MEQLLINFRLMGEEAMHLRLLCAEELRKPIDQIRWLLQQEFERRGYLSPEDREIRREVNREQQS
ncbi:MAG: hypothetical protein JXM69_00740 [Anaerolineae bacterium]|nr:hypothetical protein [Anaerolineae bacterium]